MVASLPALRLIFMGTPAFAVPTLDALLSSRHSVIAAITQPDRPRGRGQKTAPGPVKARALQAGVPVLQPASLKAPEVRAALTALHADLAVVAAYGKILSSAVIAIPRLGTINVHASLLPKYRGAAPIQRAVAAGEPETGVTIMRVVLALDAGPMLTTVRRPIDGDETSADVERGLAQLGAAALVDTVDRLSLGPVEEVPQDDSRATYANRLTKEDGLIDWSQPAQTVHNLIRAMHPWPNAFTFLAGQRLILLRSIVDDRAHDRAPGTIVAAAGDQLRVAAGSGTLLLTELQAEGKRPMPVRDFLSGHPLSIGDCFTSAP
jgi:methionyl-tRNA formyltransferase